MDPSSSRIFFGSLESQERQRILEERKDESISLHSASTNLTITKPGGGNVPSFGAGVGGAGVGVGVSDGREVLGLSEESLESRRKHEEMVRKFEMQKNLKNIVIPTGDGEVKMRLRELKQPICYFGEVAHDRRERLRALITKIAIETGNIPTFTKIAGVVQEGSGIRDEENEFFLYEGDASLKEIRIQIAKESLKNASIRIEHSKIRKITIDPLEEEDILDNEMKKVACFEMKMCQFGDTSSLIRGSFIKDGSLFASSGGSGDCKVWSIPECELRTKLMGHVGRVNDIKFHPNALNASTHEVYGKIATASSDNTVRLWTMDFERSIQKNLILKGHEDRVNRILFHNLGTHLISCSHDKTWRFWDMERRKDLIVQTGHSKPIYTSSLHPDGSLLVIFVY